MTPYVPSNSQQSLRIQAKKLACKIIERENIDVHGNIIPYRKPIQEIIDAGFSHPDAEWAWKQVIRKLRNEVVDTRVLCPVCKKSLLICKCE